MMLYSFGPKTHQKFLSFELDMGKKVMISDCEKRHSCQPDLAEKTCKHSHLGLVSSNFHGFLADSTLCGR